MTEQNFLLGLLLNKLKYKWKLLRKVRMNNNIETLNNFKIIRSELKYANFLPVSFSKCHIMSFLIKCTHVLYNILIKSELGRVEFYKDLRVTFDSKLTFAYQIDNNDSLNSRGFILSCGKKKILISFVCYILFTSVQASICDHCLDPIIGKFIQIHWRKFRDVF